MYIYIHIQWVILYGTPFQGKRDPYYDCSHIFKDSYGSGMGIVCLRGLSNGGSLKIPTDILNLDKNIWKGLASWWFQPI